MKIIHSLAVLAVLATTALAGCVTTTDPATGTAQQPSAVEIIAEVQSATNIACKFIPTAATIANILTAGNAGVATAAAISQAICNALAPTPHGRHGAALVHGWRVSKGAVSGVPIRGAFVN